MSTIFSDYDEINQVSEAVCFFLRYNLVKDSTFTRGSWERGYNINWAKLRYLPSIKGVQRRTYQVGDDSFLNKLINETELSNSTIKSHEDFMNRWTGKFNMSDIKIKKDDKLNLNYIEVAGRSLADLGYGYMQLTALLLTILFEGKYKQNLVEDKITEIFSDKKHQELFFEYKHILLEEPEANLHPKFQSQLADLINDARTKLKVMNHFIIETHSEYMIRKFQYLVAKGEMKPEDVVIYYFNDPNNVPAGEKQIKKITIEEDGSLSDDFGPGFYDEAANWELELLKMKRNKTRQN